jgi:hypothetical protein
VSAQDAGPGVPDVPRRSRRSVSRLIGDLTYTGAE